MRRERERKDEFERRMEESDRRKEEAREYYRELLQHTDEVYGERWLD